MITPSAENDTSTVTTAAHTVEVRPIAPAGRRLSPFGLVLSPETALHQGFVSLADQAVASATNFVTGVIIARACSKEEFGLYMLGFSLILLITDLQTSLISTPYMVYAPRLKGSAHALYTGSILIHQLAFSLFTMLALLCGAFVVTIGVAPRGLGPLMWALVAVIAMIMLREFARRVCFARLKLKTAFFFDTCVAVVQISGLLVLVRFGLLSACLLYTSKADVPGHNIAIPVYADHLEGWPIVAKRLLDIVISLTLLIVLFPLFLIVALWIKVDSQGPVFFAQERIGLNKRRFRIHKFRTMVTDAEKMQSSLEELNEVSGPVFKIKEDPRITRVGRVLRRASIDELPQLFNVLTGGMSLVGPRPLPVRDYQGLERNWHRRRFSVRPGITCLWQVNGRSSVQFEKWMELDMQYIDQWSLWLDLKILAKTMPAVLKGTGAA